MDGCRPEATPIGPTCCTGGRFLVAHNISPSMDTSADAKPRPAISSARWPDPSSMSVQLR